VTRLESDGLLNHTLGVKRAFRYFAQCSRVEIEFRRILGLETTAPLPLSYIVAAIEHDPALLDELARLIEEKRQINS
jgi:hypothetical protein